MPYINEEMRRRDNDENYSLESQIYDLIQVIKYTYEEDEYEGVCNYAISRLVSGVMKPNTGWRYKWLNRAHGTFLSAAAEFYRRVVGPYEDKAIEKNGDIPEYEQSAMVHRSVS